MLQNSYLGMMRLFIFMHFFPFLWDLLRLKLETIKLSMKRYMVWKDTSAQSQGSIDHEQLSGQWLRRPRLPLEFHCHFGGILLSLSLHVLQISRIFRIFIYSPIHSSIQQKFVLFTPCARLSTYLWPTLYTVNIFELLLICTYLQSWGISLRPC